MSPNINSFVGDLVAMAQAVEELPKVQSELERAQRDISDLAQSVQDREIAIINYKAEIAELNNKVRSLEVERDDASFRVMEAEDLTHNTLNRLRAIQTALGGTVDALNPPKPQPEPEKVQEAPNDPNHGSTQPAAVELSQGQGVTDPMTVAHDQATESSSASTTANQSENASISTHTKEASNSDANPTPEASTGQGSSEEQPKPYLNKRYHYHPVYVPLHDWIEGGGTEADYHWRPNGLSL